MNLPNFTKPLPPKTKYTFNGSSKDLFNKTGKIINRRLSEYFESLADSPHFENFSLAVVQCKTNWNDNAQIPMLWDLIYNASGFKTPIPVSIGLNGYHLKNLKDFTYSFVTVPTNNKPYVPQGMAVKRVASLTGGNYWGKATVSGVAFSLREIFNKNFRSGFSDLRKTLRKEITNLPTEYSYFNIL